MILKEQVTKMLTESIYGDIGKGDARAGRALVCKIYLRLMEARKKHERYAAHEYEALDVIAAEMDELTYAILHESRERQLDEALDVIATCCRFILGEHLPQKKREDA